MKKYLPQKPDIQINKPLKCVFKELKSLLGKTEFEKALDINKQYPSPVENEKDSFWIKHAKIIGINPRIAQTYFNIVKYAMTFPEDSIHILPVWEDGCCGNIYARINWKLNTKWLDSELTELGYDTPEKQLKLTVNLLHALGKTVGFDLTGHTDKFSEEVFIVPDCFEWIKLNDEKTKQIKYNDTNDVYPLLKNCIINFLKEHKTADNKEIEDNNLFENHNYEELEEIIFGETNRTQRRIELMNYVRNEGFETIPVTEHTPSRPVEFDKMVLDENGCYADFKINNKHSDALIFNSITPYRWYKIDNNGFIDINNPIEKTFEYFINRAKDIQKTYNFDFLRADMAHNQISHAHANPEKNSEYSHEMWKMVKETIQKDNNVPYFASFAEAFLSEYYIDGINDIENKGFDSVLGISNFKFLDKDFAKLIKDYTEIAQNRSITPSIVSITNDSDKQENNKYHQSPLANEIRYFIQLLYASLTGYTGMGFECRNNKPLHYNEFSGCFTNYQPDKYMWGNNLKLFKSINRIRKVYSKIINNKTKSVLLPSEAESALVWLNYEDNTPKYLFIANFNARNAKQDIFIKYPDNCKNKILKPYFSLTKNVLFIDKIKTDLSYIKNVPFGEARIYKIL